MEFKINSAEGRIVNVTFTFDDESVYTKTLDLQPCSHDEINEEGKTVLVFSDPMDDVTAHLSKFALDFKAGKEKELRDVKEVDPALIGQSITVEEVVIG